MYDRTNPEIAGAFQQAKEFLAHKENRIGSWTHLAMKDVKKLKGCVEGCSPTDPQAKYFSAPGALMKFLRPSCWGEALSQFDDVVKQRHRQSNIYTMHQSSATDWYDILSCLSEAGKRFTKNGTGWFF